MTKSKFVAEVTFKIFLDPFFVFICFTSISSKKLTILPKNWYNRLEHWIFYLTLSGAGPYHIETSPLISSTNQ